MQLFALEHAYQIPWHADSISCKHDGFKWNDVQCQSFSASWITAHHGQTMAHLSKQFGNRRGSSGGHRVANNTNEGATWIEIK